FYFIENIVMILHHTGNLCGKLVENTLMFCKIPIRILKTTISRPGTRLTSNSHLRKMEIGRKIDITRKYHFQHDRLANLRVILYLIYFVFLLFSIVSIVFI